MATNDREAGDKPKPEWVKNTTGRQMIVTARTYEEVVEDLRLPEKYLSHGERVLSVGEGLSDFARVLREKKGVNVIAVDPIYALGSKLLQRDPKLVVQAMKEVYGENVALTRHKGFTGKFDESEELPLFDPKGVVAGSIYALPFRAQTFDTILANRVFEHIDFVKALPELLRVLRPHGEIRMAGLKLQVDVADRTLSDTILVMENSFMGYDIKHPGISTSLEALTQQDAFSAYVFVDQYPRAKVSRREPSLLVGSILIIRNDHRLPSFSPYKGKGYDPDLDQLVKIVSTFQGRRGPLYEVSDRLNLIIRK